MIAIFSLPLVAFWTIVDSESPATVRNFRLLLTLGTMMILGAMVFFKQHLLDKELISLLQATQSSFDDLKRLQGQLVQSEKMASLGQLVGGAAHELNNPITAMLGYSELLNASSLEGELRVLAEKIGEQVRSARSLVGSLLSFARQVPSEKAPVDLNAVVQTALKLSQPELRSRRINVHASLAQELPPVMGDSNQLLQVFMHFINAQLSSRQGQEWTDVWVATTRQAQDVVLELRNAADHASGIAEQGSTMLSGGRLTQGSDVGFATCNGIVQEHQGRIVQRVLPEGDLIFQVVLPVLSDLVRRRRV